LDFVWIFFDFLVDLFFDWFGFVGCILSLFWGFLTFLTDYVLSVLVSSFYVLFRCVNFWYFLLSNLSNSPTTFLNFISFLKGEVILDVC